jgi:hypothetical protein
MFEPPPAANSGGTWSDRHGVVECDPALGASGSCIDPRDFASHEPFAEHHPQIPPLRRGGGEVQGSGAAEQAGPVCREALALAEGRSRQIAQAEAYGQAVTCRPRCSRLRGFLWACSCVCSRVGCRSPARAADHWPGRLRASGLSAE